MTDRDYMQLAIDKAREGIANGQSPFGCTVVRDGEILAVEHNIVWLTTDITAHAEVTALRAACRKIGDIDLSGSTIYSTTEPCPMCFSASHWARVRRIVFGTRISDAANAGFNELELSNETMRELGLSDVEIVPDFMEEECRALFTQWREANPDGAY